MFCCILPIMSCVQSFSSAVYVPSCVIWFIFPPDWQHMTKCPGVLPYAHCFPRGEQSCCLDQFHEPFLIQSRFLILEVISVVCSFVYFVLFIPQGKFFPPSVSGESFNLSLKMTCIALVTTSTDISFSQFLDDASSILYEDYVRDKVSIFRRKDAKIRD